MILHLTLKRKWFDEIVIGRKTEEYRSIKPYWLVRLYDFEREIESQVIDEIIADLKDPFKNHKDLEELYSYFGIKPKQFASIKFTNGYGKNSPTFFRNLKFITVGFGDPQLGAPSGERVFILGVK